MPITLLAVFLALAASLQAADPPALRLPDSIRPARHTAELTLVPGTESFTAKIDIDVTLSRPAPLIWLNATGLTIAEASVDIAGTTRAATIEPGGDDYIGLSFPAPLPEGPARLKIKYSGKITPKNNEGIFQGRESGNDYLFTQFETIHARRAFPCFDQPDMKSTWQLTLRIRQSDKAFSNTPQISEQSESAGWKRVSFAPTKPISSYLVAFAVGPFDVVDAGQAGQRRVPVRIITPKGKAHQAQFAAAITASVIDRLEAYFGIPYPYDKADQVALPLVAGFSAMENAGLITYDQALILADPASDSENRQRIYTSVATHELAHQWFGNAVTMKWWDDTWLNEGFATWTASKILAEWKPDWNSRTGDLLGTLSAVAQDSLVATRRIQQPIESKNDIANAFDGITYMKGAAVIRMFESWVGEAAFQRGVRAYLNRYNGRNAASADFLDAIASAGERRLPAAFATFLKQPGIPRVAIDLKCDGPPRLALSQKRYLPLGSSETANRIWQVPVCVSYQSGGTLRKECFLLDKPAAEFRLAQASSCPEYILANDQAAGYYISAYSPELLRKLPLSRLRPAERLLAAHDIDALSRAGEIAPSAALDAAFQLAADTNHNVASTALNILKLAQQHVPANLLPNYARAIHKALGPSARALGWTARPADSADTRLLRATIVPVAACDGADPVLSAEAQRLAASWLNTRQGVQPEMLGPVLTTAACVGGQPFVEALQREIPKVTDLAQRTVMFQAMVSSPDPAVVRRTLPYILTSGIDTRETWYMLVYPLLKPATRSVPFEFAKENYDRLIQVLPSGSANDSRAELINVGGIFCDATSRREFVSFFEPRADKFTGGPRTYQQALERIKLCEARQAANGPGIAAYFAAQ